MSNCIGHTEDVGVRCYSDAGEMPDTTLPPTTRLPSAATTPPVSAGQYGHTFYPPPHSLPPH